MSLSLTLASPLDTLSLSSLLMLAGTVEADDQLAISLAASVTGIVAADDQLVISPAASVRLDSGDTDRKHE